MDNAELVMEATGPDYRLEFYSRKAIKRLPGYRTYIHNKTGLKRHTIRTKRQLKDEEDFVLYDGTTKQGLDICSTIEQIGYEHKDITVREYLNSEIILVTFHWDNGVNRSFILRNNLNKLLQFDIRLLFGYDPHCVAVNDSGTMLLAVTDVSSEPDKRNVDIVLASIPMAYLFIAPLNRNKRYRNFDREKASSNLSFQNVRVTSAARLNHAYHMSAISINTAVHIELDMCHLTEDGYIKCSSCRSVTLAMDKRSLTQLTALKATSNPGPKGAGGKFCFINKQKT
jgi:hypothetical protein